MYIMNNAAHNGIVHVQPTSNQGAKTAPLSLNLVLLKSLDHRRASVSVSSEMFPGDHVCLHLLDLESPFAKCLRSPYTMTSADLFDTSSTASAG